VESLCYRLSEASRRAGDEAAMRAFDKASLQWTRGTRPELSATTWMVESRTSLSTVYRVRKEGGVWGCNCKAGLNARICWHAALLMAVEAAWDETADGDVAPPVDDGPGDNWGGWRAHAVGVGDDLPPIPLPDGLEREKALALVYAAVDEIFV
jgi:hypothetical protein